MTKHPSYRARDQPQNGSASQHRKDKIMHKFEKRDAKSRTLVILAVVGLAAATPTVKSRLERKCRCP